MKRKPTVSARYREWPGRNCALGQFISNESDRTLEAYQVQPNLIREHANHEHDTARGGYAHRQLFELIQNSADALSLKSQPGRIQVHLNKHFLYCADDGHPLNEDGVRALMSAHLSPKRDTNEIGRFGLGFKSMLGVSDQVEFFSRSGSLRFSKQYAADRITEKIGNFSKSLGFPALRQPEPIDPHPEFEEDERLRRIANWADNIVRLQLTNGVYNDLSTQLKNFPSSFLLFVDHVRNLTLLNNQSEHQRHIRRKRKAGRIRLLDGQDESTWMRYKWKHRLSNEAKEDSRTLDDREEVSISWAVPLNSLSGSGFFWAYFPTKTASLVAGILNAPWKTNEDRQNLLPGVYNAELIRVAARNIANTITNLSTERDPAQHLDALPRRRESGDSEHAELLRSEIFRNLRDSKVVPDQRGTLRNRDDISYPPSDLTPDRGLDLRPFDSWSSYSKGPQDWLHNSALSRNRLAVIDRLFDTSAPRRSIAQWFGALLDGGTIEERISASKAAIEVAALIPEHLRSKKVLGEFLVDSRGLSRSLEPEEIFLPNYMVDDQELGSGSYIHPILSADGETVVALRKLGISEPSDERIFRGLARRMLLPDNFPDSPETDFHEFWRISRTLSPHDAYKVIGELKYNRKEGAIWPRNLMVRSLGGDWRNLYSVLLPGTIAPEDGSRDREQTIDLAFHESDRELLNLLGACEQPQPNRDFSVEPKFQEFLEAKRAEFRKLPNLPHVPERNYLKFESAKGLGPLQVLSDLSDVGAMQISSQLLNSESIFKTWTLEHTGSNKRSYPRMPSESFEIFMLRNYGRINTSNGIVPIQDAMGPEPIDIFALRHLLDLPLGDKIKRSFNLAEPSEFLGAIPEIIGDEDPIPLCDVWPGLRRHLSPDLVMCQLVRCESIRSLGRSLTCVKHAQNVFLAQAAGESEQYELNAVSRALNLDLGARELVEILLYRTADKIERLREDIKKCATDSERLLKAVGEQQLRERLPDSYLAVEEHDGIELSDLDIADAAIANWHTGALKEFASSLNHLDPPSIWAGSRRAVEFVKSLGFSSEWAGERARKREPYLEVSGPLTLPALHAYQNEIAKNIKMLLGNGGGESSPRRGMVSLPTGSGKTRVAVQAIVEAMRDERFAGGILWIADRDELCEQAVEAWNQVWSCFGVDSSVLRISRLWAGQPTPLPVSDLHVVVASIQTLKSKLANQRIQYEFLADFKLVVYDEAHRSIAPSSTSVMEDIGLTRFQRVNEPFLLGLTATPYRGHNESETDRLVRRYGRNRLDEGAFESDDSQAVVRELQEMGVLAQADHEIIEGETFPLDYFTPEEWSKLRKWDFPWLPEQVEARIASSVERTRRIIDAYKTHIDPDWPTLIFATSVDHAQTLAALLNRRGVKSRAVSGKTERAVRRRIVERFRAGEITALVNYGVFREGFDAPKTRSIIVARPVYSPNLYFQMIGRGLRGPKNGGDERCLILNVQDNIETFSKELAFSELDWLWSRS